MGLRPGLSSQAEKTPSPVLVGGVQMRKEPIITDYASRKMPLAAKNP